jgi:transcriptional regulator with XRE-family HTH domain
MATWSHECWHARTLLRMTQQEAADACCVSLSTWWRWEHGRSEPERHVKESVRDAMTVEHIAYMGAKVAALMSKSGRRRVERD